jgi:nitroimidazol reductase NimA-like FMN-containing flavoprotein (pyridoxamine 5'-phosphate oxidase superfamily)
MRRKDKEIHDRELIERIIAQAQVCRLGLCKDEMPYIVPVCFGYDGEHIYFHTAREGKKINYMTANKRICFELEHEVALIPAEQSACEWSFSFYSIIGFGTVEEIIEAQVKADALNQIMKHYSQRKWHFNPGPLENTRLWRISIEQITGKHSKDKANGRVMKDG